MTLYIRLLFTGIGESAKRDAIQIALAKARIGALDNFSKFRLLGMSGSQRVMICEIILN